MTQYRTGNPLGSMAPKDLFDNAQNIDNWANGEEPFYEDRFGQMRRSFSGMNFEFEAAQTGREAEFTQQLGQMGYISKGAYGAGVILERYNEYVAVPGAVSGGTSAFYRPGPGAALPLTLEGDWSADGPKLLQMVSDDVLRSELETDLTLVNGGDFSPAVSLLAGFVSSQARTLESRFADAVRLDVGLGLTPNDSSVDNGPGLNAILLAAAAARVPLDGYGATFYVRTPVEPQSHQRLRRCRIVSMGSPDGAEVAKSHIPVVHVDGVTETKTDMIFDEVIVDGSRSLWPNIASMGVPGLEGGGGEDGGMHAWRIAGRVTDSFWRNCHGVNAGTAGWAIHNPLPGTAIDYQHKNLVFENCTGTGNREHGMFADSFKGIKWIGGALTGNGLDLNATDPLEHGNRGCRDSLGKLFGMPFDLEAYGPNYLGSMFTDFLIQSVDCRGNAIMPTIYNPIASNTEGFQPARNIRIIDCDLDMGLITGEDRADNTEGLALNVFGDRGAVEPYINMVVHSRLDGRPRYVGVSELDQGIGFINAASPKVILTNCSFFNVSCAALTQNLQLSPQLQVIATKTSGAAAAAITIDLETTRGAPQCGVDLRYSLSITGALASGGVFAANLTAPTGYVIDRVELQVVTVAAVPVKSSAVINGAGATATLFVDSSADTTLSGGVRVTLLPII